MKDFDWELLHELYKNPNMTKVANVLYITQPSLTKRLQHIEAEFDVTIVERTPKGLEFTPEGKYLAEQAGLYMRFLKQTRSHLAQMQEESAPSLAIGSAYTFSKYGLTDMLMRFRMACPEVKIAIHSNSSHLLYRQVVEGSVDVAFVNGDFKDGVNRILIRKNQAYLVTKEPIMDYNELRSMNRLGYITNPESSVLLNRWWQEVFREDAGTLPVMGYVDNVWQMVQHGLGYTICFLPDEYTNPYNLALHPLRYADGSPVCRNTWLISPKEKRIDSATEYFVSFVEQDRKGITNEGTGLENSDRSV